MEKNNPVYKNKEKSHQHHHAHRGTAMRNIMRPIAGKQIRLGKKDEKQHEQHGDGHHKMDHEDRMQMLYMHYMQILWIYWMLVILGIWMVLSPLPLTFSYGKATVAPSGGREVWLSLQQRISFKTWSDIISGLLLVFFGWRPLTPNRRPISLWICRVFKAPIGPKKESYGLWNQHVK